MYLVIFLIVLLWVGRRNSAATVSAAAMTGGRHVPRQVSRLGGSNIDGNQFDNGTTQPIFESQWSGFDPPIGNIVFAVDGGQDGQNPAQPIIVAQRSQVTTLTRFQILGGGEPSTTPLVPPDVDAINPVVRRG